MNATKIKEALDCVDLPPASKKMLAEALAVNALFYRIDDDVYAARWDGTNWWTWKLEVGSQEYSLDKDFTRCSCPAGGVCRHIKALKYGRRS